MHAFGVTRQTHPGGERLFVDYAGDTVPVIVDRLTGETRPARIFVAVLGASSFTYAEATWTQALPDWIAVHTHALAAMSERLSRTINVRFRGARIPGAGQHQGRGDQGLPLRPTGEPHLRGDGGSLWHRHPAGKAAQAARTERTFIVSDKRSLWRRSRPARRSWSGICSAACVTGASMALPN
jgi:hypothetical protein